MRPYRRTLLGWIAVTATLAGCLEGDESETDDEDEDGNGDGDRDGNGNGDSENGESDDDDAGNDSEDGDSTDEDESDDGQDDVTDATGEESLEIAVGPNGDPVFDPATVRIDPETTVEWVWESSGHNVVPGAVPDGSDWSGQEETLEEGETYEHTFDVPGTYAYVCEPHEDLGMAGEIRVDDA